MKKLLYSSVVLLLFSFSIILFQVSCQKEADADTNEISATQANKIIFCKEYSDSNYTTELWLANYDGTNQTKLNISLPSGYRIRSEGILSVSPDGKKIFFGANLNEKKYIFSCNIDGSNVTQFIEGGSEIFRFGNGTAF